MCVSGGCISVGAESRGSLRLQVWSSCEIRAWTGQGWQGDRQQRGRSMMDGRMRQGVRRWQPCGCRGREGVSVPPRLTPEEPELTGVGGSKSEVHGWPTFPSRSWWAAWVGQWCRGKTPGPRPLPQRARV